MAKKTKKTKKVKVAGLGEAHIQATFNNIIICSYATNLHFC